MPVQVHVVACGFTKAATRGGPSIRNFLQTVPRTDVSTRPPILTSPATTRPLPPSQPGQLPSNLRKRPRELACDSSRLGEGTGQQCNTDALHGGADALLQGGADALQGGAYVLQGGVDRQCYAAGSSVPPKRLHPGTGPATSATYADTGPIAAAIPAAFPVAASTSAAPPHAAALPASPVLAAASVASPDAAATSAAPPHAAALPAASFVTAATSAALPHAAATSEASMLPYVSLLSGNQPGTLALAVPCQTGCNPTFGCRRGTAAAAAHGIVCSCASHTLDDAGDAQPVAATARTSTIALPSQNDEPPQPVRRPSHRSIHDNSPKPSAEAAAVATSAVAFRASSDLRQLEASARPKSTHDLSEANSVLKAAGSASSALEHCLISEPPLQSMIAVKCVSKAKAADTATSDQHAELESASQETVLMASNDVDLSKVDINEQHRILRNLNVPKHGSRRTPGRGPGARRSAGHNGRRGAHGGGRQQGIAEAFRRQT